MRRRLAPLALAGLPLLAGAAVALPMTASPAGSGSAGELTLTGAGTTALAEPLSSVTVSVSRLPARPGAPLVAPRYLVTARIDAGSATAGDLLVHVLDQTLWVSGRVALARLSPAETLDLFHPQVDASLLEHSQTADTVEISIAATDIRTATTGTTTPTSTATTASTTTSQPKAALQTCVADPEKPVTPHSDFPAASYEVPTAGRIRQSSPTLADVRIDGHEETVAVFGDEDGLLYLVDAATCQILPGWPQRLVVPAGQLLPRLAPDNRHAVIESTPAVGFPDGPGGPAMIVVGAGSTWDNTGVGEEEAFNLAGQELWDLPVHGRSQNANGDFSSASFGPVVPGTGLDVVFGSWDGELYVLDAAGHIVASYDNKETIWSSPALYKLPGESTDDVVVGLDKTEKLTKGGCIGGVLADLRWTTAPPAGSSAAVVSHAVAGGGLYVVHESACQAAPPGSSRGQAVWSSPAIGVLGGMLVAVVGTSYYDSPYGPGTDRLYVYALRVGGPFLLTPVWEAATRGPVFGSPAIGRVGAPGSGGSGTAVVDTSFVCPPGKQTLASCQATGTSAVQAWVVPRSGRMLTSLWVRSLPGGDSLDSPVLAPLRGEQTNDVLVGSAGGMLPLDGGTGAFLDGTGTNPPQLAIHSACILFNAPAIAHVIGAGRYSGWYAYELCSYGGSAQGGGLYAFHLPEPPAGPPAWPMFRGDPSHSGVAWRTLNVPPPAGDPG